MTIKIDWVLNNKLAVGPAPRSIEDLNELKRNKISCILSLCSKNEINTEFNLEDHFISKRVVLPDHKYKENLRIDQLHIALDTLSKLIKLGPVYIHCVAGIERSPLVCMAWLITNHNLTPTQALDYLMDVHIGTCPLPQQFKLLHLLKI